MVHEIQRINQKHLKTSYKSINKRQSYSWKSSYGEARQYIKGKKNLKFWSNWRSKNCT